MKRVKPENGQLSPDFTSAPPKRFTSPQFFQHTNISTAYAPYMNSVQNFMFSSSTVSVPPPPPALQQWSFQRHAPPPKLFDPTQPPPSFASQENKNSSVPPNLTQMCLPPPIHTRPISIRGRGSRGNFRGNYDRGVRLKHSPNINNSIQQPSSFLFNKNSTNVALDTSNQNTLIVELDCNEDNQTLINKKSKRKPMSTRYTRAKEWDHDDALKALSLEKEYNSLQRTPMLILKFPDPELNKYIVKKYSPYIETVHFQQPSTPRYCFVQLKVGADLDKVRQELCEIPFGAGKITAERKFQNTEEGQPVTPQEIDPYTLYIGNLPTQISVKTVKEHFPKASRIDIGYAQRMKYTRYAFIRYNNVEDAMEAYKNTFNTLVANRSLIVRFRRAKGNIGLPGKSVIPNPKKELTKVTASTVQSKDLPKLHLSQIPIEGKDITVESDNKLNVFKENQKLTSSITTAPNKVLEPSLNLMLNVAIKSEPTDSTYPLVENDCVMHLNNILGTRIKDEPFDDDELLAQAHCYDEDELDEDDFDCEPEEEDDFENITHQNTRSVNKPEHGPQKQQPHLSWENIRQTELNREEKKPNIQNLLPFSFNSKQNSLLPDVFSCKSDKDKSILSNSSEKPDDLDELFNSMNPEDEDEEYDF